jgi:hypothetical protein
MGTTGLINVFERINSSLGVTWANSVISTCSEYMTFTEIILAVSVVVTALHMFARCTQWLQTIQRLALTVLTQQMFSLTPKAGGSTENSVTCIAYSCLILLTVSLGNYLHVTEHQTFVSSAKFMFASALRETFEFLTKGETVLPITGLMVVYMMMTLSNKTNSKNNTVETAQQVLVDSLSMMVFDEVCDLLIPDTWPFAVQCLVTLSMCAITKRVTESLLPEVQQYSYLRTSMSLTTILCKLDHPITTLAIMGVMISSTSTPKTTLVYIQPMYDIITMSLFDMAMRQGRINIRTLIPNDQLFGFASSLTLLVYTKHLLEEHKNKMKN